MVFANRLQAGKLLVEKLSDYANRTEVLVLAIPRGGVVVGAEIARSLKVELDVIVTKKIGAPDNLELAIGAVAEHGEPIFDQQLITHLNIDRLYLKEATVRVHEKIQDYIDKFRGGKALDISQKIVIVTDDGVATGLTVEAALTWLRKQNPASIILAIPTGAKDSMKRLENLADRTICLDKPDWFMAVGQFYQEFEQVSDEEVMKILREN